MKWILNSGSAGTDIVLFIPEKKLLYVLPKTTCKLHNPEIFHAWFRWRSANDAFFLHHCQNKGEFLN